METFEYKVLIRHQNDVSEMLEAAGKAGWELVAVLAFSQYGAIWHYFKRKL